MTKKVWGKKVVIICSYSDMRSSMLTTLVLIATHRACYASRLGALAQQMAGGKRLATGGMALRSVAGLGAEYSRNFKE